VLEMARQMTAAYYNEIDPFAAAWLRELIQDGQIAPGEVDERDIREVQASDLRGFVQHHWFAGIGGWSLALRLAGWPDDRPVWTGSCPCQPFSAAGAGLGGDDPRHLWPAWFRLIRECRPDTVFGEQVEAAIAHGWLDLVCDDLEGEGYATGAVSLPACSVGAFHIRQRLWWVALTAGVRQSVDTSQRQELPAAGIEAEGVALGACGEGAAGGLAVALHAERGPLDGPREDERDGDDAGRAQAHGQPGTRSQVRGLADTLPAGRAERRAEPRDRPATGCRGTRGLAVPEPVGCAGAVQAPSRTGRRRAAEPDLRGEAGGLGNAASAGREVPLDESRSGSATGSEGQADLLTRGSVGFWRNAIFIPCRDWKARPVEPTIQPLAHGVPNRVGLLRGAGNAIVPEVAAAFVQAVMEVL
jgi:DNA (cytosine-5)-methyltransferase 1